MGYTGPYSLATRCATEFLASVTAIYLGEAVLANELLPSTKGHNLGFGWVAFGFGFAFFAALQLFSRVSAHVNPAMCLALWIIGELDAKDFFAISLCEVAGMLLGGVFVVAHFWPHFRTLPEPPAEEEEEQLLRRRDALSPAARALASYATRHDRAVPNKSVHKISDLKCFLLPASEHDEDLDGDGVLEEYFAADPVHRLVRRRSIQVADLQAHLRNLHVHSTLRRRACPGCQPAMCTPLIPDDAIIRSESVDYDIPPSAAETSVTIPLPNLSTNSAPVPCFHADSAPSTCMVINPLSIDATNDATNNNTHDHTTNRPTHNALVTKDAGNDIPTTPDQSKRSPSLHETFVKSPVLENAKLRANALYAAAVMADQNAKLSIFATRPAIFYPLANFVTEFMCTTSLILAALILAENARSLPPALLPLYSRGLNSFLIGLIIVVMILGLGGPTGIAANPARDLGPRLAHWLLPIPGKGSSEFGYAWIPFFAPLCGGAAAAGLFKAIKPLFDP